MSSQLTCNKNLYPLQETKQDLHNFITEKNGRKKQRKFSMPAASSCWTDKMWQRLSWNAMYCLVWSLVDGGWHPFNGKVEFDGWDKSHRFTFKPSFGLVKEIWDCGGNIHNDMKSMQTLHERNHIMTWNLAGDSGTIMLLNKCWIFNLFHCTWEKLFKYRCNRRQKERRLQQDKDKFPLFHLQPDGPVWVLFRKKSRRPVRRCPCGTV